MQEREGQERKREESRVPVRRGSNQVRVLQRWIRGPIPERIPDMPHGRGGG